MALRISGEESEMDYLFGEKSEWYPNKFPCPQADCNNKSAELMVSIKPEALSVLSVFDLTAQEAFAALNGMGLPEEQDCGPTAVRVAFKEPIKSVDARLVKGTNRSVIDSIEFGNGTRVFLGASAYGAIVYRIAKKRSFVKEVLSET
jgi:hypothetical protein